MKKFFGYALYLLFILSSCQSEKTQSVDATATAVVDDKVYSRVDIMPRFPGCEDLAKEKRSPCASKKMFAYLSENIQYPAAAKAEGKDGQAVISFVVDKSGKIRDVEIVKDPGSGIGEEALRIVKSFPDWTPGVQAGNKVHVKYLIPVKFKL